MSQKDSFAALRIPNFRNYLLARFLSTFGWQMQGVVVGWHVYSLTKDEFSLGLIGLAEALPLIVVSLYAGHVVDNNERKKIILRCMILLVICWLFLFIVSLDAISYFTSHKVFFIYFAIFLSGIVRGFIGPANFAFLGQLIPKELYPNAISWSTSNWQLASVLGPAAGGFLFAFAGTAGSYGTVVCITAIAAFLISKVEKKPLPPVTDETSMFDSLSLGLKYVFKNKIILSSITLDLFAVLFGGAVALLPVFAHDILSVGPEGLGVLRAAPSIGAVLMGLIMIKYSPAHNAGRNLLINVFLFGVCMIVFAFSKTFYLSVFILFLSGAFDQVSVVIRSMIIQIYTPDNMKGRVSAVDSIFIGSSNEIGAFESGTAAKFMGLIPSVIFGGCMTLIVVITTFFISPKIRDLKLNKTDELKI
ncbi:MFS transporter [soil metagenome]